MSFQKLDNRIKALEAKRSYNEEKKKKIKAALTMEFMSSEEEEESDGETWFTIKNYPWRSDELNKILKDLDKKSENIGSKRGRRQAVKRRHVRENSGRCMPAGVADSLMWAIMSP